MVGGLLRAGAAVRALSRQPRDATPPEPFELFCGDLAHPESLKPPFEGVDRLYLFPVPETASAVVELARAAGAQRVVLLSSISAEYKAGDLSGDRVRPGVADDDRAGPNTRRGARPGHPV